MLHEFNSSLLIGNDMPGKVGK